jgi:hypothetical protein
MPSQIEDLLLQLGFTPEDFNEVRRARDRAEAVQKLETLKVRFKSALRRVIPSLHPDRTNGDPVKSKQLQILLDFARELEKTQIPQEVVTPRILIHEVTFHNPNPSTRRRTGWAGLPDEIRTQVTSNNVASTVAGMRPSGVNRGR